MGFPSGSVVPLPTANGHAKEKYLREAILQQATFPAQRQTLVSIQNS